MKNNKSAILAVTILGMNISAMGDLTIEGNLNVLSNLTSQTLSATNANVNTLNVSGDVIVSGVLQADGAAVTNLSGANLVGGSVVSGSLATGAVTAAKIQPGAINDSHIAADAAISQSKISGLTDSVASLNVHLVASGNPHGVTAAQIGALTNETDAIALAALSYYAQTNSVIRWQDSTDSNIWWESKGGTNITAFQKEVVQEGLNIVFNSDFKDGSDNSTLYPFTLQFPFNTNGWSGFVDEFLYGEMAAFIWSPNGSIWVGQPPSSGCTLYPYSGSPAGNATLVSRLGWTTNVLASYNLPSGNVWQAIASIQQSKVTRWQDSTDTNIWWEANGGTNLTIWTLGSETGVRVTFSADFADCENATLYPLELPWPFATNGWWGGVEDYYGTPVAVISSPNCGVMWMSSADATVIPPSGGNGEAYLTIKTSQTTNNLVMSYNLPTGDVWHALSALYPSSNPSNFVSATTVGDLVSATTSNLLSVTGNGSQLTGITAAQVGAYTSGQTDAAITQALASVDLESVVRTNHTGDVHIDGALSALLFQGDGSGLTNITSVSLGAGSVGPVQLADGSVTESKLAVGSVTANKLASGSVGTNKADIVQWNAWGDGRYLPSGSDLVLDSPGRIVAGLGVSLANMDIDAYGVMQLGANEATQRIDCTVGAMQMGYNFGNQIIENFAIGAVQRGWNLGDQMIKSEANGASQIGMNTGLQIIDYASSGASQEGQNDGTQTVGTVSHGVQQRGYNIGQQSTEWYALGASQFGANSGVQLIKTEAYGAVQVGWNDGAETIGPHAYGAQQVGHVAAGAAATNSGRGSIQLLNLSSNQMALVTGHASIGLGACIVSNDQSIVAGDGLQSHGQGTVTAYGFFGDGSGLTNLTVTQVDAYTDSNAVAAVMNAVTNSPESVAATRVSLGLGSAATHGADEFAPADLTQYASDTVVYSNGQFHAAVAVQLTPSDVTNAVLLAWQNIDTDKTDDLPRTGGTMTGDLDMGANRVKNLPAPQADGDAISKAYLLQVLTHLPPQGDLSMGVYTNGTPLAF